MKQRDYSSSRWLTPIDGLLGVLNVIYSLLAVFVTACVLVWPVSAGILNGPVTNPANGHSYYLLTQNTWTASEAEAVTLGGHLVTINDAAENTWVLNTFSKFGGNAKTLWIGLNDSAMEGTFVWSSGETASYRNWSGSEPNGSSSAEDYVHMYDLDRGSFTGKWNDYADGTSEYGVPLHGVVEVAAARPLVNTSTVSSINTNSAILNGTVNPNGFATTAQFEYGLTTSYSSTANVTLSPDNGMTVQNVSATISGLQAGQTYHYRLSAINAQGSSAGEDMTFATMALPFTYISDGSGITITGYTGPGGDVVIPSTINGMPVTAIGEDAFYNEDGVTSVTIPSGVTSIGDYSFFYCTSMISVTISSSVTSIGYYAFWGCTGLTSVTIPASVTSIGSSAFGYCTSLTAISVDGLNAAYGSLDGVLFNKSQTTLIQFPAGRTGTYAIPGTVTSIENYSFSYCAGLTSVTIPASVTSIGSSTFGYCTSLTAISVDGLNAAYGSLDGVLFNKSQTTLIRFPAGRTETYSIPGTVTSIGNYSFSNCAGLTSVTIPASVTSIGDRAFYYCSSLISVTISSNVTSIGYDAFWGCIGLTSVTIPASVTSIGSSAFGYCTSLTAISVDGLNAAYSSLDGVLFNKSQTTLIQFPAGRTGTYSIPGTVISISDYAFYSDYSDLTSVTIPSSVTSIGDYVFYGCTSLTSATFIGSAPSMGWGVFDNTASGFTVYYYTGKSGFTSPIWLDYPAVNLGPFPGPDIALEQPADTTLPFGGEKNFGRVAVGDAAVMVFTVRNTGGQDLTGLVLSLDSHNSGEFAVSPPGATTLASGATTTFAVTFSPAAPTPSFATLHIASNDADQNPFDIALKGNFTVADAIDQPDLAISDDGFAPWIAQSATTHDGVDAARSGIISDDEYSSLQGSLTGPGTLTFWWNVSSEEECDYLELFLDDGYEFSISGETGWQQRSITIPAGTHTVEWRYTKDGSVSSGQDAGWLDEVVFVPHTLPDFDYTTNGDGTIAITGYNGPGGDVTIPETIDGFPVTSIADSAFEGRGDLTHITIPEGVTSIGDYAFSDCDGLTRVSIPASVTVIGYGAFFYCDVLNAITVDPNNSSYSSVDGVLFDKDQTILIQCPEAKTGSYIIPGSVTDIEDSAFEDCSDLTGITLPDGLIYIGDSAFAWCEELTVLTIPASVTHIGGGAFFGCRELTELTIPGGVTNIGSWTFYGCSGLASVTIPDNVTSIGGWAFYQCSGLTNLTIPAGVTRIEQGTFYGCSNLTGMTIPDGVTFLGGSAFNSCSSLKNLSIPDSVKSIGDWTFASCASLTRVTIPASVTSIGFDDENYEAGGTFDSCTKLTAITVDPLNANFSSVDGVLFNKNQTRLIQYPAGRAGSYPIPASVTDIGGGAFAASGKLTSVTIPAGVTGIGHRAFNFCSSLTTIEVDEANTDFLSVDGVLFDESQTRLIQYPVGKSGSYAIPSTVIVIDDGAFASCAGLTGVTIPNGVASMGSEVFYGCTGLTSATLSSSLTNIGYRTFAACRSLTSITIPNSVTYVEDEAFYACTSLSGVTFGNSLTHIGDRAFAKCPGLTSLSIPSSVTEIDFGAFSECSGLTSITIPASVTDIAGETFSGCSGLTSVIIPSGVISIGDDAFLDCSGLSGITIPSGVTYLGEDAFSGCSGLTSVTIPSGVTVISDSLFDGCTSLASVNIPASVTRIGEDAFSDCSGLTGVTIPEGVKVIEDGAFYECAGLTSVSIPASVSYLNEEAFRICTGLTSISVDAANPNYSSVGGVLFDKLQTTLIQYPAGRSGAYTIPASVTRVSDMAFVGSNGITNIAVEAGNPNYSSVNGVLFNQTQSLLLQYPGGRNGSYTIPTGVTDIRMGAFALCNGLTGVTLPASLSRIGEYAFYGSSSLTSISVDPANPNFASFAGKLYDKSQDTLVAYPPGLSGVATIPDGVTRIGVTAFGRCSALTGVILPAGLTDIGEEAFDSCAALTSVTLPASLRRVGSDAFYGCSSLTGITLPSGLSRIGDDVFADCHSLTSVTIPSSVTRIGDAAFEDCRGLSSVTFMGNAPATDWEPFGGNASGFMVYFYDGKTGFTTPLWKDTLAESLGLYPGPQIALEQPENLALSDDGTIDFGMVDVGQTASRVFTIRNTGGQNLIGLAISLDGANSDEFTVSPPGATTLVSGASTTFSVAFTPNASTPSSAAIHIVSNDVDQNPFDVNLSGNGVTPPYTYTTSGGQITITGYNGPGGDVAIPATINSLPVTGIGNHAFYNISSLNSITIPTTITNIGVGAFHSCSNMTAVTIPESVTSIGIGAFWGCGSLTAITVHPANSSYSSLGGVLFNKNQTTLHTYPGAKAGSYTIPPSVTNIESGAFAVCRDLTGVTIPASLTSIGYEALAFCSNLTSIAIPSGVTNIGIAAFWGCDSLIAITVDPANSAYSSLDGTLFNKSQNMLHTCPGGKSGSYTIPTSVTIIGDKAFASCTSLTNITIPTSIKSIGWEGFAYCTGLTKISVPASITSIGYGAFQGCTKLTSANFMGYAPGMGDGVFDRASNGFTIYYFGVTSGFTSPTWMGYPAVNIGLLLGNYDYRLTTNAYSPQADWSAAVKQEFGPNAEVVDWNTLKNDFGGSIESLRGLFDYLEIGINNPGEGVTWNGSQIWSGGRSYGVNRYEGSVPGGYLVHDQIQNDWVVLGSWYNDRRVIARVPLSVEIPNVTTPTSANITSTTATLGGNVTSDGGAIITGRGVVYAPTATNSDPKIGGTGVTLVAGTGTTGVFTVNASDLTPGVAYSFSAYATNSQGTGYSPTGSFTTLSNNANLANLTLSEGSLSPAFVSDVTSYASSVAYPVSSIAITATAENGNTTIKVNGTTVASGTASPAIPLTVGTNPITIEVTAQDGTTTKVYAVTVTRGMPTWDISADYSSASNPSGAWSYGRKWSVEAMGMDLFTYRWGGSGWYLGNVGNGGPSIQGGANMWAKNNGNGYPCGRWTCPKPGKYSINGAFNAADSRGMDSFVYVVINGAIVFSNRIQSYPQSVAFTNNGVSLKQGDIVDFTIVWGGGVYSEYSWTDVDAVISELDGTTPSTNPNLTGLTPSDGTLSPAFSSSTTGYAVSVANSVLSISLTSITADKDATVQVNGVFTPSGTASDPVFLPVGSTQIPVLVTAQDGVTTKTYTVTVTRAPSSLATLSALAPSVGILNPPFAADIVDYTTTVPNGVTSVTVTAETTDAGATAKVNGATVPPGSASNPINLNVASNVITTVVTAGDGSTTKTYTITVTRLEPMVVTTAPASGLTPESAVLNATVNPRDSAVVYFEYGLTNAYGFTTASQEISGTTAVPVSIAVDGLAGSTLYHYRAVAVGGGSTVYGDNQTFTTMAEPPVAATGSPGFVSATGATLVGAVNPKGMPAQVRFEYGLTTLYGTTTPVQNLAAGNQLVDVLSPVSGLIAGATYHYRIVATTSAGTARGASVSFVAKDDPGSNTGHPTAAPTVTTGGVSNLTANSATLLGSANPNEGTTVVRFEYGTTTAYGRTTVQPGIGNGKDPVVISLPAHDLLPGTTYHYRLTATNSLGTTRGEDAVFTTPYLAPEVETGAVNALSTTSARVSGTVRAHHADADVFIDFGTNPGSLAQSVRATPATVSGDVTTEVSAQLPNLIEGNTYYYQVRAENSGGIGLGGIGSFAAGVVSDLLQQFPDEIAAGEHEGSVTVHLTPGGIGGGWRFAGERQWRVSGSTATGLTSGYRVIEFRPVPGYQQAPNETLLVVSGSAPVVMNRAYTASGSTGSGGLVVTLKPAALAEASVPEASRARWRLFGQSDAQWKDSGAVLSGLVPGEYVIECRPVAGRSTPPSVTATVTNGSPTAATITYFRAGDPVGTPPEILSFESVSSEGDRPYAYVGQISSDVGMSTGFAVRPRVVATAGHVVFDDGTLAATTGLQWFFQRDGGVHEPAARTPRGYYLMSGYAAQRAADNSPGTSTPESQNLDAASLYFLEDVTRGGFSGYLASDSAVNQYVTSGALKTLVGYPVDGIAPVNQGRMHATPLANVTFASAFGQTYTTSQIRSSGGNSGGPLCIQHANGNYYPAAIYLGGTAQTVVRAIDGDIVDLFGYAEVSAYAGIGGTGGRLTQSGTTPLDPPTDKGAIEVRIEPEAARAAGAGWRVQAQEDFQASGSQITGLTPNSYTVQFAAVAGFMPPTPQSVVIQGGQLTSITFTYEEIIYPPVITSPNTVTGTRGQPLGYQITATHSPGFFTLLGTLPSGMSFNADNGLISGTPQEAGNFPVTIGASGAGGSDSRVVNLTVRPGLAAQSVTAPYEQPMSYRIASSETGGDATYAAVNLPAGLVLDAATGWISGTPAIPGLYSVPVTVSRKGASATATLTLKITGTVPVITQQPVAERSIEYGLGTTLTVAASGLPAPAFQWYEGISGDTTHPVTGATAATFITPPLTSSRSYWVRASSISGSVDSTATVITLLPSTNAFLASLSLSAGALSPAFNSAILSYVASVPYTASSVSLVPKVQVAQSTLKINGAPSTPGVASDPLPLSVGSNTIIIEVTAGNGTTAKNYTITITRAEAPPPPVVTTDPATNLTDISATLKGTVIPNSPVSVSFQYGLTESYGNTTAWQNSSGTAPLPIQAMATGLSGDTTYHYRIVVYSSVLGQSYYGDDLAFTTGHERPLAATGSPAGVSPTGATLIGAVDTKGLATAAHFEYGLTTQYGSVTPTQNIPVGSGVSDVIASIGGLTPGATYHYRLVATSEAGTRAGEDVSFQAISGGGSGDGVVDMPPTVATGGVSDLTTTSASLKGVVNPNEGTSFVFFRYGPTDAYGSATESVSVGNGNQEVNVTLPIAGLVPGTVYHYRLVATNSLGTREGSDATFTSGYFPSLVTTGTAAALTATSATLNGTVRARGDHAEVWFDYGTDGVTFPNSIRAFPTHVSGDQETPVNVDLANLNGVVTYYYKVRAVSSGGTQSGNVASFQVGVLRGLVQDFTREVPAVDRQGQVMVNLSPPGIGGWRFVGESQWRASGVAVTGLTTGDREIEYKPVPGYIQPIGEIVISGESLVTLDREYYVAGAAGTGTLRVLLEPETLAAMSVPETSRVQWRLAAGSSTAWRNSGEEMTGLQPGSYLVECKAVAGKNTPSPVNVLVSNAETTTAGITYFPASAPNLNPPSVVPFATTSTSRNLPYAYVGQVRSGTGSHSGFVVKPRVVATAAQAVFDEATLAATNGVQWLLQRDHGTYEPDPQVPRGFYSFDGYAAQRSVEHTPGVLSMESQNLNVAALYFAEDAGREGFSGFLASDRGDNEFLQSSALKTLVGYPVSGISTGNQGRMHATPPVSAAFAWSLGRTYTSTSIRGIGGMAGGPLCVQRDGGAYYPAGIYVGGINQGIVRAIDNAVIDLFTRAEVSSNGGDNNTGGGITHSSFPSLGTSTTVGGVSVTIEPAAARNAGAGWRLRPETSYRLSSAQKTGLYPGTYVLELKTVSGFPVQSQPSVTVTGGKLTAITFTYGQELTPLESWRLTNFGTSENTGNAADSADPDGDGSANRSEYAAGTNPKSAMDVLKILTMEKSTSGLTVTVKGKADRRYALQRSSSMEEGSWSNVASIGPLPSDQSSVPLTDPNPHPSSGFYRIEVSAP